MFIELEQILISFTHTLPLELFAFVASFVEEVIAPIPSPTVMIVTGSLASLEGRALSGLIPLAVIAALGKTIGALVVYFVTNKAGHLVMTRFSRFFGVTHEEVVQLGNKLGNGVRDYFLLTALRAFPFMPSVVVSVGSGLIKVPLRLFIISTFFGTIIRDGIYLYAGYVGTEILRVFLSHAATLETYTELAVIITIIFLLGYRYFTKKKNSVPLRRD